MHASVQVKLIDFGFAAALPEEPPGKLRGLVGTMDYAAPEVVSWYADAGDGASGEAGTPCGGWSQGRLALPSRCPHDSLAKGRTMPSSTISGLVA